MRSDPEIHTPGNAEGSEIGFEAIEAEEAGAGDGVVRGDADEAAGVEEEGEDEEEDEGEEEEAGQHGSGSGQVVGDAGGEEGEGQVFLGLGVVGGVVVGVGVGGVSAGGEDAVEHFGWGFPGGRREDTHFSQLFVISESQRE